jgi:fumarate reductase subunit C
MLALLVFIVIGINHRDRVGERYNAHAPALEEVNSGEVESGEVDGADEALAPIESSTAEETH